MYSNPGNIEAGTFVECLCNMHYVVYMRGMRLVIRLQPISAFYYAWMILADNITHLGITSFMTSKTWIYVLY